MVKISPTNGRFKEIGVETPEWEGAEDADAASNLGVFWFPFLPLGDLEFFRLAPTTPATSATPETPGALGLP